MNRVFIPALAAAGIVLAANANEEPASADHQTEHALDAINPALSVVIDGLYYHENSKEGMGHLKEEMSGFGHAHGDGHDHGMENGFNLRHLEIQLSAEMEDYFRATAIAAIDEEGAELEVAEVETTGLPWGFQAKAGKFFSDFGRINAQHPHQWDFADQPLIYELTLGEHGLNEKGVQLSWRAPTPYPLRFGAEVLQGENEKMYAQQEADELPENDGPRLGVGWVKFSPLQSERHALEFGLFGASGSHQEIHEEGVATNFYDGLNWFAGGDATYTYRSGKDHGQGDATVQAEYFYRGKELDLQSAAGQLEARQDGYYVQGTYGILPRWRTGLRWEQVGLTNEEQEPGEETATYGDSWRASAMVDFTPSAFARIRFQASNGDYETADGMENVWEAFVQLTVTFGAHRHADGTACSGHH